MEHWFKFDAEKLQKELEQKELKEFSGYMTQKIDLWETPGNEKEWDRGLGKR